MRHEALAMADYRDEPIVLLFGDSAAARERARQTAALAGCRVAAAEPIARAVERLDRQVAADSVLIEVEGEEPPGLVPLLDRLQLEAVRHGRPAVVVAPAGLIDLVAARAPSSRVIHLCAPTAAERVEALAFASRRRPVTLHDVSREGHALLQQLSEEVGRIATILASLSEEESEALAGTRALEGAESEEPAIDAACIRSLIRARRLRDQYFRGGLFADPAWDMLLDLMAARLEKNRVAVSSLCIAAAVPATTALRWIKALTDRGLFVRSADPQDGRRVYIELSDEAARALSAYLRAVQRNGQSVI